MEQPAAQRVEYNLGFVLANDLYFLRMYSGRGYQRCRVLRDDAPGHGMPQGPMQQPVDVTDAAGSQWPTANAALPKQSRIGFREVDRPQLLNGGGSELRLDLVSDEPAIPLERLSRQIRAGPTVPAIHELAKRLSLGSTRVPRADSLRSSVNLAAASRLVPFTDAYRVSRAPLVPGTSNLSPQLALPRRLM